MNFIKTYWRALLIALCLLWMNATYSSDWSTDVSKTPDQTTVYYGTNGFEDHYTTQYGITSSYSHPANPFFANLTRILLLILVVMYWRKMSRKWLLIPYGLIFFSYLVSIFVGANGDGPMQFGLLALVLGGLVFIRKKQHLA